MISESALMALFVAVSVASTDALDQKGAATEVTVSHADSGMSPEKGWHHSFDDARTAAEKNGLPLLIHFEADWCGACRTMESTVLRQAPVLERFGASVVAVRINADKDPDLISRFSVSSLPTEVIVSPDGRELGRYVGGTTLKDYLARLDRVARPADAQLSAEQPTETDNEAFRPCLIAVRDGKMVGLGGFSPVVLQKDKQWIRGSEDFVGNYLGVDYFFRSAEERDQFQQSPEQYIPRLHGFDPVELHLARRARSGVIELGAFYKGQLFFFSSEKNRQRFQSNPAWYADKLLMQDIQNADDYPFLRVMTVN